MIELLLILLALPWLTGVTEMSTWLITLAGAVPVAVLLAYRSRRRAPAHDL